MKNRRFLYFSLFAALCIHFAFFFSIQQMGIKTFNHATTLLNLASNKNDEFLREIFQPAEEIVLESVTSVELKEEHTRNFDLIFPKKEICFDRYSQGLSSVNFDAEAVLSCTLSGSRLPVEYIASDYPPSGEFSFADEKYESLGPLCGSEHFDVQVEYAAKRFRPGYVFKVTLIPKTGIVFNRIHQNYYFVLDRSNSIPRTRYLLNKMAVSEVLDLLHEEDHFNILIFDSHVVRLAEKPIGCTQDNISLARDFLDRHGHGGLFAVTELYASLGKIIPVSVPEKEVNSAILLSDGDTYLSSEKQRVLIGGWTLKNRGKVALYCAATGKGNNLGLMELLSSFNKGQVIYAADHRQIGQKMKQLIRMIHNPIGKEIVATAIPIDKQMNILLQPKQQRMADLYQNRPFVIYGSTNRLADFVLFLQGKYYDQRFDIKKEISFSQAQVGSPSIERQWTALLAQEYYEKFFADGNVAHLESAKQLLLPLNLPVPFLE